MRSVRAFVLLVLLWIGAAGAASAAPSFPPLTGRVVDGAHMLSPQATEKLTQDLAALEAQTGHQMVVATIPDLQGYPIEDYGYQLGRTWALGRKGVNDGAILLVAPNERKVRIEVGYGLEPVLTDALSSVILQTKVIPQFKEGRMEQGVLDGAAAIIQQLSLPDDQAKAQVQAAAQAQDEGEGSMYEIPILFLVILALWLFAMLGRGRRDGLWIIPYLLFSGGSSRGGRGGGWGGGGGSGGGGGFSGGGGSFGGGGSSGSW